MNNKKKKGTQTVPGVRARVKTENNKIHKHKQVTNSTENKTV